MKNATRMRSFFIACLATVEAFLPAVTGHAATIIHSNDVLGEVEPCGCRSNPMGGVVRKENFLKKIREKDSSILQLDAGDLFFPSDAMPELLLKQSELQASFLAKSMNLLKQDAIVPGEKDFALGYSVFNKIKKNASFKVLAANLKRKKGGHLFENHAIFKRKIQQGEKAKVLRVGVFGIVGDQLAWPLELKASSPVAAARAEVKALQGKADLIVALTHQGYEKDVELAQAVQGIDIIIGGHSQSFLQKPVQVGKTWIYQSSFRNQYVGAISLDRPIQSEKYQLVAMDASYDSPSSASNQMEGLIREFKSSLAKLNSKKEGDIVQANAGDDATASEPILLGSRFQTFPRCAECHWKQFDFWRKTPHVRALESLVDKQQSMNKECLSCHSVGLGDLLGFTDVERLGEYHHLVPSPQESVNQVDSFSHPGLVSFLKTMERASTLKSEVKILPTESTMTLRRAVGTLSRSWAPVQCENCHQPGENHPFSGSYSKNVETAACLKCHTAERAPGWYTASGQLDKEKVQSKRALVTCPAGDLAPDEE